MQNIFSVKNAGAVFLFVIAILCFTFKAGKFIKDSWSYIMLMHIILCYIIFTYQMHQYEDINTYFP